MNQSIVVNKMDLDFISFQFFLNKFTLVLIFPTCFLGI